MPALIGNNVVLTVLIFTFILGILAVSFNLIFGFTGQLSLFHAAAFGLSAYATYLSMVHWGISFWLGMATGVVFVTADLDRDRRDLLPLQAEGALLRDRHARLLGAGAAGDPQLEQLHERLARHQLHASRRRCGSPAAASSRSPGTTMWYYVSLAAVVLAVLVYSRIVHSWMGRSFAAIRLNDELADTLGINVFRYKLICFIAGNAGAAVAGSLYAFYIGYIDPNYFSVDQSLAIIAMALLGGREFVAAPIVGALVLTALPHVIDVNAEARILIYGLILILTILLMPRGIVGLLLRRRERAA